MDEVAGTGRIRAGRVTPPRRGAILTTVALLLLATPACGGEERSAAAFCDTLQDEVTTLLQRYDGLAADLADDPDVLSGLLRSATALEETYHDLSTLGDRLEAAAPEEIEPEVRAVHEGIEEIVAANRGGGGPGAVAQSVVAAVSVVDAAVQIDSYVREHCDLTSTTG